MPNSLGLDFGTSNTVVVSGDDPADLQTVAFGTEETAASLPTVLCFLDRGPAKKPHPEVGPWAIQQFLNSLDDVRFIQSLKTFVASSLFKGTGVFGSRFEFEDLMETFLTGARDRFSGTLFPEGTRVVVGRPVVFAGSSPDDGLAMSRYRNTLARLGVEDVLFVYEPVAAAFSFADRLASDATILVADFGGGTTDYSLMRFRKSGDILTADPLGRGGIGIAGDTFDYRILDKVILPEIGKGTCYSSMGKRLEVPPNLFTNFARWHLLSIFKTSQDYKELKKLLRWCEDQDKLELFVDLVDEDQGYPLFKAVSSVKAELSSAESAELRFAPLGKDFAASVNRSDFETWIADDLKRMDRALDQTLARAGLADKDIDHVFLTGGTSFVPALRNQFKTRFGADRISGGEELTSVAKGLAMIGTRDDAADWAVH
ncbi:Hsp70 family protein [Roseibium sp. RKSG952]|uniref:Hsp70 family protein n=1 Tax=Roseibium sp. RKSG952 TaxID=2529384 RepID=UPI0012BCAB77|nr:Hsp70 family protein [Roseibium sp. RKSG952]MTI00026.1 Hsp70 family protein [Roseibium sp. RKSG952]